MNRFFAKKTQVPRRRAGRTKADISVRATPDDLTERYTFRRNRTLTGSLSSNVVSVNERKAELKSPRVHAHALRRHRHRLVVLWWAVWAGVALLAWLLYQLIALPVVTAQTVEPIDQELYALKIQDYLNSRPLERYRFALNTDMLAKYLQTNGCPEVAAVSPDTRFDGLGKSAIAITFRQPVVSWQVANKQMYVDSQGVSFERTYFKAPNVQVVDKTGVSAVDGKALASNAFLGFIGRVVGAMSAQDMTVTQVTLPPATTRQIEVTVQGIATKAKMSVDRPAGEQSEDAARALHYLVKNNLKADYVDVRVSGKAFYK